MAKKIDSSGRVARNPDGGTYKDAKNFASEVLGPANNQSEIQAAIKKARKAIRERKDETYKWKKKAIKLMKLIRDVYSSDGYCSLYNKQGELHFIATFLASLLKELFKSHSCQFSLQWGDQALQIDKEDKQRNQKDDERRTPGKIPDAILSLKDYDLPFSLVEVSGPPNQLNHQHYVGDRIKLAKHLKASLKKIRRTIKSGDEDLYEDIKLFGIQVYLNKVYVYRLYQVTRGIYVFDTALSFDLACSAGLISSFMPRLVKNLWKVKSLFADSARSVDDYLNSDHGNDSSDDSFDSRDTVNISPKKQKMK
ncbi:hypothetical protein INT48_006791 [Thamnidium elegans]|uniref:Uncharacterized protein n=1 Tax=Thamnidium elegans TaxID=101142 RepID=A0A8H7SMB8_9FUNG|nr:hypothetical protein INT48_006791 [Thamnidium elegans]